MIPVAVVILIPPASPFTWNGLVGVLRAEADGSPEVEHLFLAPHDPRDPLRLRCVLFMRSADREIAGSAARDVARRATSIPALTVDIHVLEAPSGHDLCRPPEGLVPGF